MSKATTKEKAVEWLEKNAPHIKILEWRHDGNKSRFVDTDRNVEFEYRFSGIKVKIKINPSNLFGASKEEIKEKARQTNLEKYGVEFPSQNKKIQEKTKQTNIEKYGVENPFQNKCIQEKIRRTNLEKYGVEHPAQDKKIQEKIKQTNLEKYGAENPFQNKKIQEKQRNTNLEKYGVEYPVQNKEVQEKRKQTNIENGNIAIINGKTLKEIAIEKGCGYTTIQQHHKKFGEDSAENYEKKQCQSQEYLAGIVKKIFPSQEVSSEHSTSWKTNKNKHQRFDIFIPELNLAIEYHGEQHYEPIEYFGGEKTFKEIQVRDSYKREMCKKNGIKLIEIKYDELKYDESDIEMIRNKTNCALRA